VKSLFHNNSSRSFYNLLAFSTDGSATYDCWKPVLHDTSAVPSQGRLLKEVISDPRIKNVWLVEGNQLPQIVLENTWGQKFHVEYVQLPSGAMAAHAKEV
jgi:hypothetical protein